MNIGMMLITVLNQSSKMPQNQGKLELNVVLGRGMSLRTVATQTEPWQLVNDKVVSEIGVQVDSTQDNPEDSTRQHKMNVQCAAGLKQKFFDHCYPSDVEPQSDPFSSPIASCIDESDYESSDGAQSSSSCSTNSDVDQEPQDEQTYIIFKSCCRRS